MGKSKPWMDFEVDLKRKSRMEWMSIGLTRKCLSFLRAKKRQNHFWSCLRSKRWWDVVYLFNFFLNPQRPSKPEPRRSMVAGSGTGFVTLIKTLSKLPGAPLIPLFAAVQIHCASKLMPATGPPLMEYHILVLSPLAYGPPKSAQLIDVETKWEN